METIFYAFQSELPYKKLDKALSLLGKEICVEKAARGIRGCVEIAKTIQDRIRKANFFLADVTITRKRTTWKFAGLEKILPKNGVGEINSNVAIEIGIAAGVLGWERCILVLRNGDESKLPFDIRGRRLLLDNQNRTPADLAKEIQNIINKESKFEPPLLTPKHLEQLYNDQGRPDEVIRDFLKKRAIVQITQAKDKGSNVVWNKPTKEITHLEAESEYTIAYKASIHIGEIPLFAYTHVHIELESRNDGCIGTEGTRKPINLTGDSRGETTIHSYGAYGFGGFGKPGYIVAKLIRGTPESKYPFVLAEHKIPIYLWNDTIISATCDGNDITDMIKTNVMLGKETYVTENFLGEGAKNGLIVVKKSQGITVPIRTDYKKRFPNSIV